MSCPVFYFCVRQHDAHEALPSFPCVAALQQQSHFWFSMESSCKSRQWSFLQKMHQMFGSCTCLYFQNKRVDPNSTLRVSEICLDNMENASPIFQTCRRQAWGIHGQRMPGWRLAYLSLTCQSSLGKRGSHKKRNAWVIEQDQWKDNGILLSCGGSKLRPPSQAILVPVSLSLLTCTLLSHLEVNPFFHTSSLLRLVPWSSRKVMNFPMVGWTWIIRQVGRKPSIAALCTRPTLPMHRTNSLSSLGKRTLLGRQC